MPMPTPSPRIGDELDETESAPAADDTEVVAALKEALGDEDEGVRRQAAWALRMIRIGKGHAPGESLRTRAKPMLKPKVMLRERLREDGREH
jgi:hypothetical protein